MKTRLRVFLAALFLLGIGQAVTAQNSVSDQAARLREVLPADVAERVLATIADARSKGLPAAALEQRALKFAAKGVDAASIEKSVPEHAARLMGAKNALGAVRGRQTQDDELDAGAEVLRKGVAGAQLSELARAAGSGRSLVAPLYALNSLLDRGLPADQAIQRVYDRLTARAGDAEFQRISTEGSAGAQSNKPELTGAERAAANRAANTPGGRATGRPPTIVPGNAGKDTRPTPKKPDTPPGRGRGSGEQ